MGSNTISIRGAREHNLRNVDIDIPRDRLVVLTGLSGSGKSSLAFDTIYAEGQRKYVESLSAYARQFLEQLQKPDMDSIEGLPPTIAIEQRSASHNPRSTVATTTEIYDYLRLLFARVGQPRCWHKDAKGNVCARPISAQSSTQIIDAVMAQPAGTRMLVLAPLIRGKKGNHKQVFEAMVRQGFVRARVNGQMVDLRDAKAVRAALEGMGRYEMHDIEAVVDRIVAPGPGSTPASGNFQGSAAGREQASRQGATGSAAPAPEGPGVGAGVKEQKDAPADSARTRIADSIELALKTAGGLVIISSQPAAGGSGSSGGEWTDRIFSEKYACPLHPECSLEELEPRLFSFNSPHGACPKCDGLGTILEFDPELVVPDGDRSLGDGAIDAWRKHGMRFNIYYNRIIRRLCRDFAIDPAMPFRKLPKPIQKLVLYGTTAADEATFGAHFEGVIPHLQRRWQNTESQYVKERLHEYLSEAPCEACGGVRLRPEALQVVIEVEGAPELPVVLQTPARPPAHP